MRMEAVAAAIPRESLEMAACPSEALTTRLSRYLSLTQPERAFVTALHTRAIGVPRRRDLLREGHHYGAVNVLCSGMVSRYRVLPDGRRQILNFGVPGDVIGFPASLLQRATASACCMTDVVVAPVPLESLTELFLRFPRIAAALYWAAAREAALCAERVVALGRRDADERVAYFFLELIALQGNMPGDGDRFSFPITQDLIADAVGLSTPHVNRMLRKLREQKLLVVEGHEVMVQDAAGLIHLASFDPDYFRTSPIPGL